MLTHAHRPQLGSLALLTAAASDPVTVEEFKAQARLDDPVAEGDDFLEALISAATVAVAQLTGRALLTEVWALTLDGWPGCASDEWWDGLREGPISLLSNGVVEIRKAPFRTVTKVETIAEDGTATEFAASNYYATVESGFGRLVLRQGAAWPVIAAPTRAIGGIKITFTAGYGDNASDVPAPIRQAIKLLATRWYENRDTMEQAQVPADIALLLGKYKVLR